MAPSLQTIGSRHSLLPTDDSDLTFDAAFEKIDEIKRATQEVVGHADRLKPGLAIFDLDAPNMKQVEDTEREIALLEDIWGVDKAFKEKWTRWKDGKFGDLDVSSMETSALQFKKKVMKLGRSIKRWKVHAMVKDQIEQFLKTLPLITDLRNEAMRDRHWSELKMEIKKSFDPTADDFTLEKVFALGLNLHSDFISELSGIANKELGIESALRDIAEAWENVSIEMTTHKEVYFKIRDVEDLFSQLEDNQVVCPP